jgi:hypothetical protein
MEDCCCLYVFIHVKDGGGMGAIGDCQISRGAYYQLQPNDLGPWKIYLPPNTASRAAASKRGKKEAWANDRRAFDIWSEVGMKEVETGREKGK